MIARGETSLPQFGHVGVPAATGLGGGGGGATAVAELRMANAGAGAATELTAAGTVIKDWHEGQGICIPPYSGPHWMCC